MKKWKLEGSGLVDRPTIRKIGQDVIIEDGVRIFHPENLEIGNNVYIGHDTILRGYFKGETIIGDNTWIGQMCFLHAGGGIHIGKNVGIGPTVKMFAARHSETGEDVALSFAPLDLQPITIEDGANIGIGAAIMGGVTISRGMTVGTNAVVTKNFPAYSVVAGVPARLLRMRKP
ncbi:MAG: DapH/DapD/GlmU-related protein [Nitrospinota bacterium]|nr:DapH/DapD/GlmU-related protein [Nitrospinota bacterium]